MNKIKIQNNGCRSDNLFKKSIINTKNIKDLNPKYNVDIKKYQNPFELYDIFNDSIKHILLSQPFFVNIKNIPLKKIEYSYFKNDLSKKEVDINIILEGCLDCIKDSM